ncbi:MAG: hypothetical protein ACOC0O_03090 [Spirochaetota bacterium]
MNKPRPNRVVLSRYERRSDGVYFLDIAAHDIADLYNSYDKNAPFIRRDLDQDLVGFLIECCRELRTVPFEIRLTITNATDEERVARVRHSIAAYFSYLIERDRQDMRGRYRRSGALVAIGVAILFGSVGLRRLLLPSASFFVSVLAEGLAILAWVSIWEASALFILEWLPYHRRIGTYGRLATAPVSLRSERPPLGARVDTGP